MSWRGETNPPFVVSVAFCWQSIQRNFGPFSLTVSGARSALGEWHSWLRLQRGNELRFVALEAAKDWIVERVIAKKVNNAGPIRPGWIQAVAFPEAQRPGTNLQSANRFRLEYFQFQPLLLQPAAERIGFSRNRNAATSGWQILASLYAYDTIAIWQHRAQVSLPLVACSKGSDNTRDASLVISARPGSLFGQCVNGCDRPAMLPQPIANWPGCQPSIKPQQGS